MNDAPRRQVLPAGHPPGHRALVGFTLMVSLLVLAGCFRLVDEASALTASRLALAKKAGSQEATLPPTPGPWTGAEFKFQWMVEGATPGERFGSSVALLGDVDGDGSQEIAVGAPFASPNGINEAGSVYVVSLRTTRSLYRLDGQTGGEHFGHSLASIGDIDRDRVRDLLVGAPYADANGLADSGSASVYSGRTGRLLSTFSGTEGYNWLGFSVAGVGDASGDGFPDYAFGAPIAWQNGARAGLVILELSNGNPLQRTQIELFGEAPGDSFGWAIAGIADINQDGSEDFAVGAPDAGGSGSTSRGRVYLLSGRDGSLLYQIEGAEPGLRFGVSLASLEDLDGDDVAEIIVGAPQSPSSEAIGKAYVLSGRDGSLIYELTGSPVDGLFGHSVAGGDVDGDGRADIIVGDPRTYGNHGSVQVFSGVNGKRFLIFTNNPSRKEGIGAALAPAVDLNRDDRAELIFGAPGAPSIEGEPTGRLYVLYSQQ